MKYMWEFAQSMGIQVVHVDTEAEERYFEERHAYEDRIELEEDACYIERLERLEEEERMLEEFWLYGYPEEDN